MSLSDCTLYFKIMTMDTCLSKAHFIVEGMGDSKVSLHPCILNNVFSTLNTFPF